MIEYRHEESPPFRHYQRDGVSPGSRGGVETPNTAVPAVPAVAWKESLLDEERVRAPRPRESPSGAPQDPLRARSHGFSPAGHTWHPGNVECGRTLGWPRTSRT
jgi:hypothetical protein